jgi:hypothetical protein
LTSDRLPPETPNLARAAVRLVHEARSWWRALRVSFDRAALRPLAPAILPVAFAPFLWLLVKLEIKEPLFGDAIVFQYTGWCLRHGLKLYRDVGMADGPFIHYLHAAIQVFAGTTDRGFRTSDLLLQSAGAGTMGALLAPTSKLSRRARIASRAAWAAMSAMVWLSWYFDLSWTETTEREAFYALFGSLGMVLVYASDRGTERGARAGLFAGAFLTTTQVFGKPTGVVYPAAALLCAMLPSASKTLSLPSRLRTFWAGVLACVLTVIALLLVSGSLRGYVFWCWKIPIVGNRYLFAMNWLRTYFAGWDDYRMMGGITLAGGVAAVATGILPVRSLGLAVVGSIFFLAGCLQARAYVYQFIPVIAAFHMCLIVALSEFWAQSGDPGWPRPEGAVAAVALLFVAYHAFQDVQTSQFRWDGSSIWSAPKQSFANEEKQVGAYVKAHTRPTDTVFAYSRGENASVVLFYAERKTASPFFHSFWLDPVGLLPQSEIQPGPTELLALTRLQDEIRSVACPAVERNQPGAMALNLLEQAFRVCPNLRAMLDKDYDDAAIIGSFHVYLRKTPRQGSERGP